MTDNSNGSKRNRDESDAIQKGLEQMEIINEKKMFDVTEVSEKTTISVRTVEKYLRSGKIHGVKIRGRWFVSETSLNDFLDGKTWTETKEG